MTVTLIFDFDGTLADSNELIRKSHRYVLDTYFPGQFVDDDLRSFNGPPLEAIYEELASGQGVYFAERYRDYMHTIHDTEIKLFPGIKESLLQLKEAGVVMAIVSSKKQGVVLQGLDVLGLNDLFQLVIGSDQGMAHKPNPEAILYVMETLGSLPDRTVYIGDNRTDLEAGAAANVKSAFVQWSEKTIDEMAPIVPDYVIQEPNEFVELALNLVKE